ncbi:hypothetical protein AVEN_165854-1, partial [Araneus ventricosus]
MPGSLQVTEAVEAFAGVTGIVVDDRVNCDSAEELGDNAVKGIVRKRLADVTLKRKVQVFTMAAVGNSIIIDKDPVVVNLSNRSTASRV